MNKTAFTLLITAGILMLLAGGIFAFIKLCSMRQCWVPGLCAVWLRQ